MPLDLSKAPHQPKKPLDLSGLPDKAKPSPAPMQKPMMGAGGAFDESFEDRLMKYPNLYGIYGAIVGTGKELTKYSWLKYIYPEEREKFMALNTQEQTRQLLMDDLEAMVALGGGRLAQGVGQVVKRFLPGTHKFFTTPIFSKQFKPIKEAARYGARVKDLIGKRRAEIEKGILDSEIFIRQIQRELTPKELEAYPFLRQKIQDVDILKKIGRDDLIPVIKSPSKNLVNASKKIDKYYDEAHAFLSKHFDDVSYIDDYVTHIWDIPKNKRKEVISAFVTKNPFLKQRKIPSLEEGIKLGLKPKTTNIAEILRIYDQYKIKTVHNYNFAKQLKNMVDDEGNPLMMRADKAPPDWITIDHPAFARAMYVGKTKTDIPILSKIPVKVNPSIANEVKIITDKPFSHPAIHAVEVVNAYTKKTMLSLSFFHHHALTESAFSTGIGTKALKLWNPYKIIKEVRNKNYEIFRRAPLAKDAIDHHVTFGALEDVQRNIVQKSLQNLERRARKIPGLNVATKGIRKANDLWDAALWDYYHNTLKLYAYEANVENGLRAMRQKLGRSLTNVEIDNIKKEMGLFVNDSFGGQNWDLSKHFANPKIRQMMHWALLAPDWTLSVLKQAMAPARGAIKGGVEGRALMGRGADFWAKAALYFNLIAQAANYRNTQKHYGKGRYTWQNAPGHALNIFIGMNPDGTERYLRMGKQFREVLEWGLDPIKKVGAKLSPVARETVRQITAHGPGSGYPTEWAEQEFWESLPERAKSVLESPLPFSLRPYVHSRPGVFMFTFPTSKGMSNYKAVKLFREAIKKKDIPQIRRIYVSALENNLDAEHLYSSANSSIKADITYDNKKIAREMLLELSQMDEEAKQDALDIYRSRGTLTPEIALEMAKLIEKQERIDKQKIILRGIK